MSSGIDWPAGDVGANKHRLLRQQLTAQLHRRVVEMQHCSSSSRRRTTGRLDSDHLGVMHLMDVASRCLDDMSRGLSGSSISISELRQDRSSMTLDSVDSASSMNLLYR